MLKKIILASVLALASSQTTPGDPSNIPEPTKAPPGDDNEDDVIHPTIVPEPTKTPDPTRPPQPGGDDNAPTKGPGDEKPRDEKPDDEKPDDVIHPTIVPVPTKGPGDEKPGDEKPRDDDEKPTITPGDEKPRDDDEKPRDDDEKPTITPGDTKPGDEKPTRKPDEKPDYREVLTDLFTDPAVITPGDIKDLLADGGKEVMDALTDKQLKEIPGAVLNDVTEFWKDIKVDQVSKLTEEQISTVKADAINQLEDLKASGLTSEQWGAIDADEVKKIKDEIIKIIPTDTLSTWTKDTWDKFDFAKMMKLKGSQIPAIPVDEIAKWTDADIAAVKAHFGAMLTSAQIGAIKKKLVTMKEDTLKNFDLQSLKDAKVFDELPTEVQTSLEELKAETELRKEKLREIYAKRKAAQDKLTSAVVKDETASTADTKAEVALAREELAQVNVDVAATERSADSGSILVNEESAAFAISPVSALLLAVTPVLAAFLA